MSSIIPPFAAASDRGYKFLRVFEQYFVARSGRIVLQVEGGVSPYSWVVTGTDFTLDDASTAEQYNFITAAADATVGGIETVTITDAEGSTCTITVCTCNPNVPASSCADTMTTCTVSPDTVLNCRSAVMTVDGGCPPWHWVVSSSDGDVELAREYTNHPTNRIQCVDADCALDGCTYSVTVTDGEGASITCANGCDGADALAADAGNPSTITPGGGAVTLEFTGGLGVFTWSFVGTSTGFSFGAATTTDRLNTVSCVAGTCPTNFTPFATIRVTDACGSTLDMVLRAYNVTYGQWSSGVAVTARCQGVTEDPCNNNCVSAACPDPGIQDCEIMYPYGEFLYKAQYRFQMGGNICTCQAYTGLSYCTNSITKLTDPALMPPGWENGPDSMLWGKQDCPVESHICVQGGYYRHTWIC